jgi:hypothetical protein
VAGAALGLHAQDEGGTTGEVDAPDEAQPAVVAVQTAYTIWDRLSACEASGNWHANTGNGFSGGLQFTAGTWRAYGGSGSAWQASRETQIAVAQRVLAGQGWGAWPSCSRRLGLR